MNIKGLSLAMAAVVFLAGCAERRLKPGTYSSGHVVEAEGRAGLRAEALDQARRSAVAELLDLYVADETRTQSQGLIEEKVLARAPAYIKRHKPVEVQERSDGIRLRLRALILYQKLGQDLEQLGLVKPEGVRGRPRVLVALEETGPGAGVEVGRASEALRRRLLEQGYQAVDLSDRMNPEYRKAADPFEEARKRGAQILVTGRVSAQPMLDARLDRYHPFRARLELEALAVPEKDAVASIVQEASAVDLLPETAASKALANSGEAAAERLMRALALRYRERHEIGLAVLGAGDMEKTRSLIRSLRSLPEVAGASLDSLAGRDARIRVFVERLSADELAARILRLRGQSFQVRAVEPDNRYLELEAEGSF